MSIRAIEKVPQPTDEQVTNLTFPKDHWLRLVSQEWRQGNSLFVDSFHPIGPNGRLACNCKVSPTIRFQIYSMDGVAPQHRHLICAEGFDHLRKVVAKEGLLDTTAEVK